MKTPEESLTDFGSKRFEAEETLHLIKIPILNAHVSSRLTILLAIVPVLFLIGLMFSHYLDLHFWPITGFYEWVGNHDSMFGDSSIINWLIRGALLGGPLLIIFLNLLSVLHIRYNTNEVQLTILLKWKNLLLALAGILVFLLFIAYLVVENL